MSANTVTIQGNLTVDPAFKLAGADRRPLTKFRIASSHRRPTGETRENGKPVWEDVDTLFIDVSCWGELAVNASASLFKGCPVTVTGRLVTDIWESGEGEAKETRSQIVLKATQVSFDLSAFQINSRKTTNVAHTADGTDEVKLITAEELLQKQQGSGPAEAQQTRRDFAATGATTGASTGASSNEPVASTASTGSAGSASEGAPGSIPF